MPDQDGKLTDSEKEQVLRLLRPSGIFAGVECPICKSREWIIADHLVQAATLGPNNSVQFGGLSYPFTMAISVPCGHTLFFNAVVLGFIPAAPSDKKS
jgi:hypothetical protein